MTDRPICLVHIKDDGSPPDYLLHGDVDFLIVDERTPQDRVYRLTIQSPMSTLNYIIDDDTIGSRHDGLGMDEEGTTTIADVIADSGRVADLRRRLKGWN